MRGKILVITSSYDLTADYVINKFRDNVDFFRFNTDHLYKYDLSISNNGSFWTIKYPAKQICCDEVCAIYYRKPVLPNLNEYSPEYHRLMAKDILSMVEGLVEAYDGPCLTKPSILKRANNKILQLSLAQSIGFKLPASVITNSENTVREFLNRHQKNIVKPLSVGKIYKETSVGIIQTNLVDKSVNLEDLVIAPAYFQEYIKKDYELRVTIVNKDLFVTKIETDEKVDWRKGGDNIRYSLDVLPEKIRKMCFQLMEELGLKFGAFDFIVNNGEYFFLEVNSNGQWGWLEKTLRLSISDAIIDFLLRKEGA